MTDNSSLSRSELLMLRTLRWFDAEAKLLGQTDDDDARIFRPEALLPGVFSGFELVENAALRLLETKDFTSWRCAGPLVFLYDSGIRATLENEDGKFVYDVLPQDGLWRGPLPLPDDLTTPKEVLDYVAVMWRMTL